jgi:RNA polymerase sigma factor (sigma-70 family)
MPDRPQSHHDTPGSPEEASASEQRRLISRLFQDNNRALLNFLLTQLPNEQEAREVAQEAYVRLLQLDRPEAISFLRTYLFRIAANLAIDRLRRGVRKARIERSDSFEEWTTGPAVEREVLAAQEVGLLRQAIAELEPKYRQALIQHKFRDRPVADIAAELGVSPRMARSYIACAVLYCRLRLDGHSAPAAAAAAKELLP